MSSQHSFPKAVMVALSEDLQREIDAVGPTDARVLITGETGTGKNLLAQILHEKHPKRSKHTFRRTNVGAIVPELAASQLYGHVKGAFTGADHAVEGIVREAHEGTLFLDEISSAPPNVQVMLLTLLETRQINPVGATMQTDRPMVDVRIVSASIESPATLRSMKSFRTDLFFRLVEYHIKIPPLRERTHQIPELAAHFLGKAHLQFRRGMSEITKLNNDTVTLLSEYAWPGNMRELDHVIRAALVRSRAFPSERVLQREWIKFADYQIEGDASIPFDPMISWHDAERRFQQQWAKHALSSTDGNKAAAAHKYGLDVKTLNKYLSANDKQLSWPKPK